MRTSFRVSDDHRVRDNRVNNDRTGECLRVSLSDAQNSFHQYSCDERTINRFDPVNPFCTMFLLDDAISFTRLAWNNPYACRISKSIPLFRNSQIHYRLPFIVGNRHETMNYNRFIGIRHRG